MANRPTGGVRAQRGALFVACLALLPAVAVAIPPVVGPAELIEPRAFGYSVGDVVQRKVRLQLPKGMSLDMSSLPQTRRPGQALELRQARWSAADGELLLEYQVFLAPREVRTLEMPPLALRLQGQGGSSSSMRIDAWPVTVAPLVPLEVSPREGLGEMRPDAAPPPIDTSGERLRLALYAALLLPVALYLLQVYFGLPWWARRQRPFAQAWRRLRRLPEAPSTIERRAALRQIHAALNRSAAEVLFEPGLGRFVQLRPRFAPLQGDLSTFFRRSHDEFFADRAEPFDGRWLQQLARACRDAERGSV